MPYQNEQLQFLIWIAENLRTPFLDPFFRFLNYLDTEYFLYLVLIFICFGVSYRWGVRIFYLLSFNFLAVGFFKLHVGWPRPTFTMPEIGMFHFSSNGFPSGAAQNSMLLASLLIYYWKSRWALFIGIPFVLLMSFSRLYLGVHYPIDILGGWAFGFAIFSLYARYSGPIEKWICKIGPVYSLLFIQIIQILIYSHLKKTFLISAMGVSIGAALSALYHLYLPEAKNFSQRISRIGIALASALAILFIWPKGHLHLEYFFISLWLSLCVSPLCKKM